MAPKKLRRKVRLIRPNLQLRMTLTFVGLSALSLLLQYILFMSTLTKAALGLPNDGTVFMEQVNGILFGMLVASFGVLLPLTFGIGVILTHKIAGPVHRMQVFLNQILRGARPSDCRLRDGDDLQEFCAVLNQVTAPLRGRETASAGVEPSAALPSATRVKDAA
jgi:hypothetical protein